MKRYIKPQEKLYSEMITQKRSRRKVSGGRYRAFRKKRLTELGRMPSLTKIGKQRLRKIRVRGTKNSKERLLRIDTANVYDPKTKKYSKSKIKAVVESNANRNYVRRGIITKGSVVETEQGKAKVTSRPGQNRIVNAVLLK